MDKYVEKYFSKKYLEDIIGYNQALENTSIIFENYGGSDGGFVSVKINHQYYTHGWLEHDEDIEKFENINGELIKDDIKLTSELWGLITYWKVNDYIDEEEELTYDSFYNSHKHAILDELIKELTFSFNTFDEIYEEMLSHYLIGESGAPESVDCSGAVIDGRLNCVVEKMYMNDIIVTPVSIEISPLISKLMPLRSFNRTKSEIIDNVKNIIKELVIESYETN